RWVRTGSNERRSRMRIKVFVGESLIELDDGNTTGRVDESVERLALRLIDHCGEREQERFKPATKTSLGFHTERSWTE
ncbi:MAG: hypothetical protein PSX37_08670, partial [bacterium]|nr:hypothetical protein [bacterium]